MRSGAGRAVRARRALRAVMSFDDIITEVQSRPELWQSSHPYYKRREVHRRIWKQISRKLGVEETIVRKRWKHLKDQYRKELKKLISTQTPITELSKPAWQYFDHLGFIKDEILQNDRKRVPLLVPDNDSQEFSDDSDVTPEPEAKKPKVPVDNTKLNLILKRLRSINTALQTKIKDLDNMPVNDPDYMYLLSLLPTVKNLTELQKLQFKGKVNGWLLDAHTHNEFGDPCDTKIFLQTQIGGMQREG